MEPRKLTKLFYKNVICDLCYIKLYEQEKIAAYSISKKRTKGFICLKCSIEKKFVTDQEIIKFLKSKIPENKMSIAEQEKQRVRY